MHQERLTTEETAVVVIPMQLLSAVDSASAELPASVEVVVTRTQFEKVIKPVTDLVYCVVKDCIDQWHSIRYALSLVERSIDTVVEVSYTLYLVSWWQGMRSSA